MSGTRVRVPKKQAPTRKRLNDQHLEERIQAAMDELAQADASVDYTGNWKTEAQIMKMPKPEWLIERWLPRKGVVVIYGDPGIGKTFQLIAWAKHVQRGEPWKRLRVQQGPVLFIEGETLEGFGPRLKAFNDEIALPTGVLEAEARYVGSPTNLSSRNAVAAVIRTGLKLAKDADEPLEMVVIEPLIENMSGDENGDGMDEASRALRVIARFLDCLVVAGHHTNGTGEQERGNKKLRARVHTMIRMERIDPLTVGLVVQKQRNGEPRAMHLAKDPRGESMVLTPLEEMSVQAYDSRREDRQQSAKATRKRKDEETKVADTRQALRDRLPTEESEAVNIGRARLLLSGSGGRTDPAIDMMKALADEGEIQTKPGPRRTLLFWWPK